MKNGVSTNLCYEDVLAVVLDGHGKITPCPCLVVILKDWQHEHKVRDVQNVLVFVALNKRRMSIYHWLTFIFTVTITLLHTYSNTLHLLKQPPVSTNFLKGSCLHSAKRFEQPHSRKQQDL